MTLKRAQIVQMRGARRLRRIGDERDGVTVGVEELVYELRGAAASQGPRSSLRRLLPARVRRRGGPRLRTRSSVTPGA